MATIIPPQSDPNLELILPRLLKNDPKILNTIPKDGDDDDDLVNPDGSAVHIPSSGSKFEIQVQTGLGDFKNPVHENLTLAAAARSKGFNRDDEWTDQYLDLLPNYKYEFIRGVFFNDDPNCQLFENKPYENRDMSITLGLAYIAEFGLAQTGLLDKNNLLYRSHFGNLQFVHAMGAVKGETPQETQRKIRIWLQSLYAVYSGQNGVSPDTLLKSTGLSEFFNDGNGHSNTTFKQLLMGRTPAFNDPNIQLRALGSCMHVVEDSFAKGHTHRDDNGNGAIANFHCYDGQNHSDHSHWDSVGAEALDPTNLDSFNGIYGGRRSIDRCIEFLDAASAKQPWNDKLEKWFQDTFAISPNASNSDTSV